MAIANELLQLTSSYSVIDIGIDPDFKTDFVFYYQTPNMKSDVIGFNYFQITGRKIKLKRSPDTTVFEINETEQLSEAISEQDIVPIR